MKKFIVFVLAALLLTSCAALCDARVIVRDKSVVKIGEDINMGEELHLKDLVAIKGNVSVKGIVDEDVVAVLGSITLYPTAKVNGDVVAVGGNIVRHEGSQVKGDIVEIGISKGGANMIASYAPFIGIVGIGGFLVLKVLVLLGFIGIAAILVSFMTPQIGVISSNIEKEWVKALLWGILGALLICPVALLLAVTIIGIPLILIEILFVSIAMTMGYVAVTQIIGKKFTKAIKKPNQPMLIEVIWGLVILFLIDLVPFAGPIIKGLVATIGFGGAIVTRLGYQK